MTHYFIKLAALGLVTVSAVACSKEFNSDKPASDVMMEPIVLHASVQNSSKTHIESISSDKATVNWDNGDAISFISTTLGGNIKLDAQIQSSDKSKADFSGNIVAGTTTFAAVYPYRDNAVCSSGVISGFSIPTQQTATAGSFANGAALAMAKGEKTPAVAEVEDLQFKNLCSVIGFTFPENITFANEVIISSKYGENLAGNVTINYSDAAIASANASSVTIKPSSGNFTAGSTYYLTIAPGTYTDGLNFTIKTEGGNTYYRTTSKTIYAAAGTIYVLGKLSIELPDNCFAPKVVVSHKVTDNTLTGSDAVFSMTSDFPDEFDGAIESIVTSVDVKYGDTSIRTKDVNGKNVSGETLNRAPGCPYVPSGCTYTATITYTINNGSKLVAHKIEKDCEVQWTAPSGFAIDATPEGHTSYDTRNNEEDGSTIFGVGASYKSGLSKDVYDQCSSLLNITSTLDGNNKSGDQASQSWASHTIGATWSFDGAEGTCESTKTVHVTGIPYSYTFPTKNISDLDNAGWTRNGSVGIYDVYTCLLEAIFCTKDSKLTLNGHITSPGFYIPASESVNAKCYYTDMFYSTTAKSGLAQTIYVNVVSSQTTKSTATSATTAYTMGTDKRSHLFENLVFTSSNKYVNIAHNTTYNWAAVCTYYAIDFKVEYR